MTVLILNPKRKRNNPTNMNNPNTKRNPKRNPKRSLYGLRRFQDQKKRVSCINTKCGADTVKDRVNDYMRRLNEKRQNTTIRDGSRTGTMMLIQVHPGICPEIL